LKNIHFTLTIGVHKKEYFSKVNANELYCCHQNNVKKSKTILQSCYQILPAIIRKAS